jgi:acetyltransferase-like isoleucine patch superfamily enzyme
MKGAVSKQVKKSLFFLFLIPIDSHKYRNHISRLSYYLFVFFGYRLPLCASVLRGVWVASVIKICGGECGWITVGKGFSLNSIPHDRIKIGNRVNFGSNVKLFIPPSGKLVIGDRCVFTSDIFISAVKSVELGADCLVAEFTSIRDADHGCVSGIRINNQAMLSEPITIGSDVWIGRGVAVLKGSRIADGAVIGSNAVVKSVIPPNSINVGVPAVTIKYRQNLRLVFDRDESY